MTAVASIPGEAQKKASYAELAPLLCRFDAIRTGPWAPSDLCLVQLPSEVLPDTLSSSTRPNSASRLAYLHSELLFLRWI